MSCETVSTLLLDKKIKGKRTHILADNRAKTRQPHQPRARDLVHPQALAAEHGLAETLTLVILDHVLGAGEEAVVADGPSLVARQA